MRQLRLALASRLTRSTVSVLLIPRLVFLSLRTKRSFVLFFWEWGRGASLLLLSPGEFYIYPHSHTTKLPYVTKNFTSYTSIFNLLFFISFTLKIKPSIFKNFISTNFYILNLLFSFNLNNFLISLINRTFNFFRVLFSIRFLIQRKRQATIWCNLS